jgi:hypothetical protein
MTSKLISPPWTLCCRLFHWRTIAFDLLTAMIDALLRCHRCVLNSAILRRQSERRRSDPDPSKRRSWNPEMSQRASQERVAAERRWQTTETSWRQWWNPEIHIVFVWLGKNWWIKICSFKFLFYWWRIDEYRLFVSCFGFTGEELMNKDC